MTGSQFLGQQEIKEILSIAVSQNLECTICYLFKGRWFSGTLYICGFTNRVIHCKIDTKNSPAASNICIDLPIGLTFQHGFNKYLIETTVIGSQICQDGQTNLDTDSADVMLEMPDKIEKVKRRAFERASVPPEMVVKVLFWHRGYSDNTTRLPLETYWQGRLIDLSAGGMQIAVSQNQIDNFRTGQIVGIQFTALPYEKPILTEGMIKHIAEPADNSEQISLGVEFLGLETDAQGRIKMRNIISAVEKYKQLTSENSKPAASA